MPTRGLGGRSNPDCDTSESTVARRAADAARKRTARAAASSTAKADCLTTRRATRAAASATTKAAHAARMRATRAAAPAEEKAQRLAAARAAYRMAASCVNHTEHKTKCNAPRAATGGSPSCVDHGGSRTVRERRPASEPTHTGSRLGGAASRLGQPHHGVQCTNASPHCGL